MKTGATYKLFPDLSRPEIYLEGLTTFDPIKGNSITFVVGNSPLTPDFPCVPRLNVLRKMEKYKKMAGKMIDILHEKFKDDFLTKAELSHSLKQVYDFFTFLSEHEVSPTLKERWIKLRGLICLALYEDTSYLWRILHAAENVDKGEFKLTTQETYWLKTRSDYKYAI